MEPIQKLNKMAKRRFNSSLGLTKMTKIQIFRTNRVSKPSIPPIVLRANSPQQRQRPQTASLFLSPANSLPLSKQVQAQSQLKEKATPSRTKREMKTKVL